MQCCDMECHQDEQFLCLFGRYSVIMSSLMSNGHIKLRNQRGGIFYAQEVVRCVMFRVHYLYIVYFVVHDMMRFIAVIVVLCVLSG